MLVVQFPWGFFGTQNCVVTTEVVTVCCRRVLRVVDVTFCRAVDEVLRSSRLHEFYKKDALCLVGICDCVAVSDFPL